jgi:hypothetical protein
MKKILIDTTRSYNVQIKEASTDKVIVVDNPVETIKVSLASTTI